MAVAKKKGVEEKKKKSLQGKKKWGKMQIEKNVGPHDVVFEPFDTHIWRRASLLYHITTFYIKIERQALIESLETHDGDFFLRV